MTLYRAIPKENFIENNVNKRLETKRAPSNIPYLVDNIWEYLRPQNYPSRRHAAYASPTPKLALENASAINTNGFVVTEVVFSNLNYKLAHIQVTDARYHKDIKSITNCVIQHLGKDFTSQSLSEKLEKAVLFLPSMSKEELSTYFNLNDRNKELEDKLIEISSFWENASITIEEHNGELFFEIMENCEYKLKLVK